MEKKPGQTLTTADRHEVYVQAIFDFACHNLCLCEVHFCNVGTSDVAEIKHEQPRAARTGHAKGELRRISQKMGTGHCWSSFFSGIKLNVK